MSAPHLLICDGPPPSFLEVAEDLEIWSQTQFSEYVRSNRAYQYWRRFSSVTLVLPHLGLRSRPLLMSITLYCLSQGEVTVVDYNASRRRIDLVRVLHQFAITVFEALSLPFLLRRVRRDVSRLKEVVRQTGGVARRTGNTCLYLKTDLSFSTQVGGSVTHMAGVVNNLGAAGVAPQVFATTDNPLLHAHISVTPILPAPTFWDFREVPALLFSRSASCDVRSALSEPGPSFIYQRYCLNNYAGVLLAMDMSIPLVTEYNGSEVWISQHWGKPAAYRKLSTEIEMLNLMAASLIVVVSKVLQDELLSRGIERERILVNPNGVDPEMFNPAMNVSDLRCALGLEGKTVIGFIGTFGPWHGTEELIEAFAILLAKDRQRCEDVRLLMVGHGALHTAVQQKASKLGVQPYCIFTGQVPQKEAPRYLACCNILVAPHVANPDGSLFFGSPTKLFEYMAMGRPIVASRLGQIEEIIEHGSNGLMVSPGDPAALADELAMLLDRSDLWARLGAAARAEVLEKYTWQHHTRKIVDALERVCS